MLTTGCHQDQKPEEKPMFKFHGGIKVKHENKLKNSSVINSIPDPKEFIIRLQQNLGAKPKPVVKVGDKVKKYQLLAQGEDFSLSSRIHAPSSGVITKIASNPIIHADNLTDICIFLRPDGEDLEVEPLETCTSDELITRIEQCGIVGLGGAGFPTYFKVKKDIDTFIINAAECEPYISCDDGLIQTKANEIIKGISLMQDLIKPKRTVIGIEDNKPQAITALKKATVDQIEIAVIPTVYPSGGEKQLTKILTGKDYPKTKIAPDVSCINVGTIYSIYQAVVLGIPLTQRLVTITGSACKNPGNYLIKIGTPVEHILAHCDVTDYAEVICGGPMMGFVFNPKNTSTTKANNCFIALSQDEVANKKPVNDCIRCGECEKVCPMILLPQQLYWHNQNLDKVKNYNIENCIECACCDYVCPSNIPLAKLFVATKAQLINNLKKQQKSDHAKLRHEKRELRLERLEQERKAKMAKKRAQIKAKMQAKKSANSKDKQKLIKQAQKRVSKS